jgi:endonuclease III
MLFWACRMSRKYEVKFAIDSVKALKIAGMLYNQFYNHQSIFEDYSMPEYVLPRNLKEGTKEHALFFTYVISIDYMTDAVRLWKRARGAYELYPERFTPEKILKASSRTVETFVKKLGARYYSNAAKTWIKISQVLAEKYDGNPRNLTKEPLEIADVKKQLKDFPYLRGNKLSNFYIRAMAEKGLFKVKNLNELDIPVDKQVARFTLYTGVLKLQSEQFVGCPQEDPLRSLIEEAWRNAAKTLRTAPWKLDEPIWTVGSKLCSERKCGKCPVQDLCDKTKGVTFKENTLVWRRV